MDECAEIQQLRKEISALTQDKRKLELDAKRREEAMQSALDKACLLYTSPSPRDRTRSRMPSSA